MLFVLSKLIKGLYAQMKPLKSIFIQELYTACGIKGFYSKSLMIIYLRQNKVAHPDFVTLALRVPNGVICLISALSFHNLTTQIPHKIWIAVKRDASRPRINHPPVFIHQFSGQSFSSGVDKHTFDKIPVKIYNPEKTIADCFKFRNKIGMRIVLEALSFYKERKHLILQN